MTTASQDTPAVHAAIQRWLREVVVGLNLCPFARPVLANGTLRVVVSEARDEATLLAHITAELATLVETSDESIATTLIACPWMLSDFLDYNDFCGEVEDALHTMKLEGVIQLASFHPFYQFRGESADSLSNYTNRSPVPLFHLLREEHVTAAVLSHPDTTHIPQQNVATLEALDSEARVAMKDACQRLGAGEQCE